MAKKKKRGKGKQPKENYFSKVIEHIDRNVFDKLPYEIKREIENQAEVLNNLIINNPESAPSSVIFDFLNYTPNGEPLPPEPEKPQVYEQPKNSDLFKEISGKKMGEDTRREISMKMHKPKRLDIARKATEVEGLDPREVTDVNYLQIYNFLESLKEKPELKLIPNFVSDSISKILKSPEYQPNLEERTQEIKVAQEAPTKEKLEELVEEHRRFARIKYGFPESLTNKITPENIEFIIGQFEQELLVYKKPKRGYTITEQKASYFAAFDHCGVIFTKEEQDFSDNFFDLLEKRDETIKTAKKIAGLSGVPEQEISKITFESIEEVNKAIMTAKKEDKSIGDAIINILKPYKSPTQELDAGLFGRIDSKPVSLSQLEQERKEAEEKGAETPEEVLGKLVGLDSGQFKKLYNDLEAAGEQAEELKTTTGRLEKVDVHNLKAVVESLMENQGRISDNVKYVLERLESLAPLVKEVQEGKSDIQSAQAAISSWKLLLDTVEINHNWLANFLNIAKIPEGVGFTDYVKSLVEQMGQGTAGVSQEQFRDSVKSTLAEYFSGEIPSDELVKILKANLRAYFPPSLEEKLNETIEEKLKQVAQLTPEKVKYLSALGEKLQESHAKVMEQGRTYQERSGIMFNESQKLVKQAHYELQATRSKIRTDEKELNESLDKLLKGILADITDQESVTLTKLEEGEKYLDAKLKEHYGVVGTIEATKEKLEKSLKKSAKDASDRIEKSAKAAENVVLEKGGWPAKWGYKGWLAAASLAASISAGATCYPTYKITEWLTEPKVEKPAEELRLTDHENNIFIYVPGKGVISRGGKVLPEEVLKKLKLYKK